MYGLYGLKHHKVEKSLDVTIVTTDNGRNLNIELEFFEFAKSDIKKGQCHLGHIPIFSWRPELPLRVLVPCRGFGR